MNAPAQDILTTSPLEQGPGGGDAGLGLDHWRVHRGEDDVLWAVLDQQGLSANTLNQPVLEELDRVLSYVREQAPRGLVIRSAKRAGFMAGADIGMFREIGSADEAVELLTRAHEVVNGLAGLSVPTIALIHGHCLGGGLELALACRYRIARGDASLGFPEVQLGLHPGLGGTARLPEVIRPDEALKMMLTGKPVDAHRAKSLGLVDAVAEERHFAKAVRSAVDGGLASRAGGAAVKAMSIGPSRRLIVRQARSETARRAPEEHYPAPYRLLDLWESHGGDEAEMLRYEPRSFGELLTSDTSRNLVRVYFLREALRDAGKGEDAGVRHVHVIGAGTMGGDIAAWCAHQGLVATLEDRDAELIAPAVARAAGLFEHKHKDRRARQAAADRLVPDPRGHGRRRADLIIEAVPEKLDLKRRIFQELEGQVRHDAVLATNTSGILLGDIGEALSRPERLVGVHFFNPVSRMPLVEVVRHDATSSETAARAVAFATSISRLPVTVKSAPGFLVNRVLTPYLLEAVALVDEGVEPARVDAAAESFGMPMGPIALADQVGLDIAVDVADGQREKLDTPMAEVPDWLRRKVADGHLGVKSGRGMYDYEDGEAKTRNVNGEPDPEHVDRLVLSMVNMAVTCLGRGIVEDADSLDAAVIFGTGFAPFRGGPLNYTRARGPGAVKERLSELAGRHGRRFIPSEHWDQVFDGSGTQGGS